MNIVVCIKQVPDTNEVRIDPETKNLVRQGIPCIINPYDETGVELALELKEKYGGTVTLLSMGLPQAKKELVHGLGMGADRAILLSDKKLGGSDTLATGYALAKTIEKLDCMRRVHNKNPLTGSQGSLGVNEKDVYPETNTLQQQHTPPACGGLVDYDLIICGLEAIDGSTAQVGPAIAEHLGIPQCTYVSGVKDLQDGFIRITKKIQQFTEEYRARLPVVISVLKNSAVPRLSKQTQELEEKVELWNADHLDETKTGFNGSPTRVIHIEISGTRGKDYVDVDANLSAEERIDFIISGGLNIKKNIRPIRGNAFDMAKLIIDNMNHDGKSEAGGAAC